MLEISEAEMEEILAKHPEIIEKGLALLGRQVYVSGLRIDLLYRDKFGDRLIVELKRGTVTRNDVAQLMEYSGAIPENERSVTRIMMVANVVPPRWKKALDLHGIEWREVMQQDLVEYWKPTRSSQAGALEQVKPKMDIGHGRIWKISAGENSIFWKEFLDYEIIALGAWDEGDLNAYAGNKPRLKDRIQKYSLKRWRTKSNFYVQAWNFLTEVKEDDMIVLYRKKAIVAIGKVKGPYEYRPNEYFKYPADGHIGSYPHLRKVRWEKVFVPHKDEISERLVMKLSKPSDTFHEIKDPDCVNEILSLLQS